MTNRFSRRPLRASFLWLVLIGLVVTGAAFAHAGNSEAPNRDDKRRIDDPNYPETIRPIIELRADRADGSGPIPTADVIQPWVDLAGAHDGTLLNFRRTPSSGWVGDGSIASPHRLEFSGNEEVVSIPSRSVSELQHVGPLTAEVWFRTGFDGASSRFDYILEWVQAPTANLDPEFEGRGLSIVVHDGAIQVYANPWVRVVDVEPNTWYHVAVTKDTDDLRVYVNGDPEHQSNTPHRGMQQSEITIGSSIFRAFEVVGHYAEHFTGAIAQVTVYDGARDAAQVRGSFLRDRDLYLPSLPVPALERVVSLRADQADGSNPYPDADAISPWRDLSGSSDDATLLNFAGHDTSGWTGTAPRRLQFDGIDDVVVIPARSIDELQNVRAVSAELRFKTPSDVTNGYQYLLEWLNGIGSTCGMSIAVSNDHFQVYLRRTSSPWTRYWAEVAPALPNTDYHLVVVKEPGEVRVYVDGVRIFTDSSPELGDQGTELVLGASTWRGDGQYGDFLRGAIEAFSVWEGAMNDTEALAAAQSFGRAAPDAGIGRLAAASLSLANAGPNPARGRLAVAFSLPTSAPAMLQMIDVSGRTLESHTVNAGPGQHVIELGRGRTLAAGVYWVRLAQAGQFVTTKIAVVP